MKKREHLYRELVAGFLIIAVAAGVLIGEQYCNYQEKIAIAAAAIQENNKEDRVLGLLKGKSDFSSEEVSEQLEKYGYSGILENSFGRKFLAESVWILFGGLIFYGGYVGVLLYKKNQYQKKSAKDEQEIAEVLRQISDGKVPKDFWGFRKDEQGLWEQLERLSEYLELVKEQAFHEKEETKALVTDISHQLKTPVAALKSCFEVLKREELEAQERMEFQGRIEEQLKGLEQLVTALVNISRMEAGMITVQKEKQRIFDTLLAAVNRIWVKVDAKQMEIIVKEEETDKLEISHDRKWLCEAIVNILDNAVKYSPECSVITISCKQRSSFFRIEIKDEGIGIRKEEYHKVFQRFYRGVSECVQKKEGAGVGLYLARKIIEDHHGMIFIERKPTDKQLGTTFVVQLPFQ